MKKIVFSALAAVMLQAGGAFAGEDSGFEEECELDSFFVGAGAVMMLPQGGGDERRLAGAGMRLGWYPVEFWALEGGFSWLEDSAGIDLDVLWHWWGYERFDPFFTLGARGWIGGNSADLGPKAGIGAFYHLTDSLSLRFDADATLTLDGDQAVYYTLSTGVQWSF